MVDLFDSLKKTDPKVSDTDRLCAEALRRAISEHTGTAQGWSKSTWAKTFSLLRKELKGDESRIGLVLSWYCTNLSKPFMPQAYCASSFRKKFLAIESAMKGSAANAAQVKTELGEQVHNAVRHIGWPEHIKAHLRNIAELSIINLLAEREKVIEWRKRQTPQPPPSVREEKGCIIRTPQPQTAEQRQNYKMQEFAAILVRKLTQPQHLLQDWLRHVNEKMQNGYGVHDERLNRFIWTPDTSHFKNWCGVCIGPGFASLMELLK